MDSPKVIYDDDTLLVLDKPAGWIVNDSNTVVSAPVLQNWIRQNYDFETAKKRELRSGIVHRLDKETSGIILVAKTEDAFRNLQEKFLSRNVQKEYIALVHGRVKDKTGIITAKVGRLPWKRTKFGVLEDGREARTDYEVEKYFSKDGEDFTLVQLFPKTGRTHQIRIHLKHIGHAIVSDPLYAGRKTARIDRKWCPRMFLHASKISFDNESYKAEKPQELSQALEKLSQLI